MTGRQPCRECGVVYVGRVSMWKPGTWSPYCQRCEYDNYLKHRLVRITLICFVVCLTPLLFLWRRAMYSIDLALLAIVSWVVTLLVAGLTYWRIARRKVKPGRFGRVLIIGGPHAGKCGEYRENSQPCTHTPTHGDDEPCDSPVAALVFLDDMEGAYLVLPFFCLRKDG